MIVRVLIVLMTVVGALPFRVCTCGAVHHHHTTNPQPTQAPASPEADTPHHDPDCHAIKPRCAMTVGVSVPVLDWPTTDSFGFSAVETALPLTASVHAEIPSHPPPRGSPLYLTLNVLRN